VLVLALTIAATSPSNEIAAQPQLAGDVLSRPDWGRSLFCLWRDSGYGTGSWELAGWLFRDGERLALARWPGTRSAYQERWSGPVPGDAVALVHTHPGNVDPRPSEGDRATARALGLPVLAVSRGGVFTALPDGRVLREGGDTWYLAFPASGCSS